MVQAEALMVRSEASEGVIKAMSLVHRQLKRLEADIDEMLLYGRPMTINPRRFHLSGLLQQIAEVFRIGETEEPAHVTVIGGGDDIEVNLDPDAVRIVVERLICNSIQHTESPHEIRVELKPEGADGVTIIISDTGRGIPDEIKEKMFLPFYPQHSGRAGLGLAVAAKFAHMLGGSIAIDSVVGEGTTARFTLPTDGQT